MKNVLRFPSNSSEQTHKIVSYKKQKPADYHTIKVSNYSYSGTYALHPSGTNEIALQSSFFFCLMNKPLLLGKLWVCLSFAVCACTYSHAQYPLSIETSHSCTYLGESMASDLYEFVPSQEANQAITQIMRVMGLKPRFEIKAANVENAAAIIYDNKRYILYSQNFISQMQRATGTNWAAISILAHEIGHHLNGHTLAFGGSRPSNELEADEFSGFVLRKMGASLTDAQAAIRMLADDQGTSTHPPRSARLEAIAVGWKQADEAGTSEPIVKNTPAPTQDNSPTQENGSGSQSSSLPVDRQSLVGKVIFNANPSNDYYLTKKLDLIKATPQGMQVIGKLMRSNLEGYAFMIYNANKNYVYIADNGEIFNARKQKVGYTVEL